MQEDYIIEVSVEFEGRVTKKWSQELSRTESRILCALSKLDKFRLNPQVPFHCGPVPEKYQAANGENLEANENHSQNDPHSKIVVSMSQSPRNFDPGESSYSGK